MRNYYKVWEKTDCKLSEYFDNYTKDYTNWKAN